MNRSYSKKRHIQEANQRLEQRLLSEQWWNDPKHPEWKQYAPTDYEKRELKKAETVLNNLDPHTIASIFQIGIIFVPIVGPFISAGIGLADAAMYAKEGRNNEAGVAAFFALLPGIGAVVSKIPGVKQLGQKGMQLLSTKLITKAPLNAVEQGVLTGINLNKELIKQETNIVVKNMAANAATRTTDTTIKEVLKDIAKDGLEKGAEEIAMDVAASSNPVQKAVGTGITGLKSSWGAKSPVARGVNTLIRKS